MVLFFPNVEIELWDYTEESGIMNIYGEYEEEYILRDIVPADFQPMSPQDTLKEFGKILQDIYKVYLEGETEITDTMIIRVNGEKETYKIRGTPQHYNHFLDHKKIILEKQRKPLKLR